MAVCKAPAMVDLSQPVALSFLETSVARANRMTIQGASCSTLWGSQIATTFTPTSHHKSVGKAYPSLRCVQTTGPPSGGPAKGDNMSYLNMWKRAKERQAEETRIQIQQQMKESEDAAKRRREEQLSSILAVPAEERDRVQKQLVLDRAAAALAAAEAAIAAANEGQRGLQAENRERATAYRPRRVFSVDPKPQILSLPRQQDIAGESGGGGGGTRSSTLTLGKEATPGPDFWTWAPPPEPKGPQPLRQEKQAAESAFDTVLLERPEAKSLNLAFQSDVMGAQVAMPKLPPLQSLLEVQEMMQTPSVDSGDYTVVWDTESIDKALSMPAVQQPETAAQSGVEPDGTRWWRESGVDERDNGEVCTWTVIRGVSKDGAVEWENKWWEVSDEFDYKELGAEKSGRDARGGVWRESWRESMWKDVNTGLPHIEKSADKWARAADASEWHEKWWEHYDATGKAAKSADKWGKLAPGVVAEPGHANVWHERWGEDYDGAGAALKWTDRWAERFEEYGGITKWGDKWDERFDRSAQGRKSGETWWQGAGGDMFSKGWGEEHFGNGSVHKYGHSTTGEHWDVYEDMDTWYTPKPHFGFQDCMNQSYKLRQVAPPKKKLMKKKKEEL